MRVPVAQIWRDRAMSARDRELVFGELFCVEEEEAGGFCRGHALRDGYPGFVAAAALAPVAGAPTHKVHAARSHAMPGWPDDAGPASQGTPTPDPWLKSPGQPVPLSFGAQLRATGAPDGDWLPVDVPEPPDGGPGGRTCRMAVPLRHLSPIDRLEEDPATVAERLLGTPYLWGGNSAFGIDCSGLVQIACLACGIPCPGDSGRQAEDLGAALPGDAPVRRGDLLFWQGHVAWVAEPGWIVHANAHSMSVSREDCDAAIARIASQGGGPVTARRRPSVEAPA